MSMTELRKALKTEKVTFGTNETIKKLKKGKIKIIMLAKNCSDKARETITYYASLNKAKVMQLKEESDEIALVCKKNYGVSVLSY